jgi:hypothetical protein
MTFVIFLWLGLLAFDSGETAEAKNGGPSPWRVLSNTFNATKDQIKESKPGEVYLRE